MGRFFAGVAACFLLMTGAFLLWQGRAANSPSFPPAPKALARAAPAPLLAASAALPEAPIADPRSREQKRFGRADKDKDGRITLAELIQPRRKAFAKLDRDGNGQLSFDEWAVKTIGKFAAADSDRSRFLTPAEYANTAPKLKPRKASCACTPQFASAED